MSKKRGNGEGTLQHRADGRWSVTFFAGYQDNGKPLRKTAYGKTRQEAIEKSKKLREQIDKGIIINRRMTFEEWADEWYKGYKGSVSESTYEGYSYTLSIAKKLLGSKFLYSVKAIDIEKALKQLIAQGYSASQVGKTRTIFNQIFRKAEANDLIIKNPVRFADKLRRKKAESTKDAFTREEVAILFRQLPENRLGHTIRLMIGTGLRLQEVVCLEKEHIAPDGSLIHVRQAAENIKGRTVLNPGHTKSQLSKRDIPVPEFVRESLLFLRANANPFAWDGREAGSVYNLRTFRAKYTTMMSKIEGVRPLTPHCCRHTYVTLLQSLNVPLEVIAGLTGHSDIETTREYLHIRPEAAAQVSERYSRELAGLFQ